jgi:hypothetical protein
LSAKREDRKKILEQLVLDCTRFDLNEEESLSYMQSRTGGKGIARSRYYSIKKSLTDNELNECNSRMDRHAKSGFVINHFKRMDDLEHLQNILFKALYDETNKPVKEQSLFAISKIASNIATNSRLLVELNISSPIIDQMKTEMNKHLKSQTESRPSMERNMESWNTPSACILTEDFIKSSHWVDPASLDSSKDRVKDRVF